MHSVQTGMWDPRSLSKHVSPLPPPPLTNSRLTRVSRATPAKRITFYKSGDNQFGGVRMAIHRRSFKCFDTLLDDLSQKVPLPFGVRTVTTPRGLHAIKHLEQLQDGGCYLCSDRRHVKPINMEMASKRPNIWNNHSRRPQRPEASPSTPPGHLPYRQRRILLVKNSEPGMRRSVVLSRRSTRSLRAFLDEVSEVMQFHVRKLYTPEGRRIDSVQTLMTSPPILVCVGREAFSPLLVNYVRKSSEEKLPGLGTRSPGLGPRTPGNGAKSPATQGPRSPPHGAQSRASEYSEGHESKKSVNFGLETKKSIIHPRSDSSNRSARFSLSSEKSYGNGVSTLSQGRPAIMNDDIEKRVLVNKDGSLSVEMRVRFRLQNEETLQWSTQIKKSPSLTNDCCPLSQAQPHYLQQGQSESCSDPDSTTFEPEVVEYSSQPLQHVLEGSGCPCCYQRQEQQYDLWENPAHSHKQRPAAPPHKSSHTHTMMRHTHSSSSSSSCNSRRVVRCRAQLSNCGGGSGSEQSQLVQEEMCVTERRVEVEQHGDTHVEVCRVSRCCSRSEVLAIDTNLLPVSRKSVEDELMLEEGDRPLSGISSSSHVLQSLKEDHDDEDDDLPPSASQCGESNESTPSPISQTGTDRPTGNISAGSVHSTKHKKHKDTEERGSRTVSAACSCHCGSATPHSTTGADEVDRAPSSKSRTSRASCRSTTARTPNSEEGVADDEDDEVKKVVSGLSGQTGLSAGSRQSGASSVCHNCGGCQHGVNSSSSSRASQSSHHTNQASPKPGSPPHDQENANDGSEEDGSDVSAVSTQSNKSNLTNHGCCSQISNVVEGRASRAMSRKSNLEPAEKEEERPPSATSATSHRSSRSHKSCCNGATDATTEKEEDRSPSAMSALSNLSAKSSKSQKSNKNGTAETLDIKTREEAEGQNVEERAGSSLSAKSCISAKSSASVKSHKSNCPSHRVASPADNASVEEDETNNRAPSSLSVKSTKEERPDSVLSAKSAKSTKSNVSGKSSKSHKSTCSHCVRAISPDAEDPIEDATGKEGETEVEDRAASTLSAKSNVSAKSNKSRKSTKGSQRSPSPRSEAGGDEEERAASQMSARSVKSNTSVKSNCNGNEKVAEEAEEEENENVEEETQPRPESVASAKSENEERPASAVSRKSKKSICNSNTDETPETGDNTGDSDQAEVRAASALSGKSASSAKSHHTNCSKSSRVASPAKDTSKTEVDRSPSAMSGKSNTSAKSAKSKGSNHTPASPNTDEAVVPSTETNEEEKQDENQERVASAMSVKSKSSVRSGTSHKSNSNQHVKSVSPSSNVVTIKTPEGVDEEEDKTTERPTSAASAKSGKSIAVIETADADEKQEEDNALKIKSSEHGKTLSPKRTRSPRTRSPKASSPSSPQSSGQQLLPNPGVGETRGASALSVHSTTSAKSGRSKCHCGKAKKEKETEVKEVEKKEEDEKLKSEDDKEPSDRAASVLSSSSKKERESGDPEPPLSRNSSGSVSLGLPEDQETGDSDSGKSNVSFHTGSKGRVMTATPDVRKSTGESAKEHIKNTESAVSQKSNNNGSGSTLSHNLPAVDIPTIETPGGGNNEGEEGEEQKTERPASELSAKSSRSHKSSCSCKVKAAARLGDSKPKEQRSSTSQTKAGNDLETGSVRSANNLDAVDSRTPSAMSSASAKVRSKSPASASAKNASVGKIPAGDSTNNDTENKASSRPASKTKGKDVTDDAASVCSKSPCCLRPESAASAKSVSKMKASKQSKQEDPVISEDLNPVKGDSGSVKSVKPSKPCPSHSSRVSSKVETCSESTLSHSLSAADLLKETMATTRPYSRQSKASKTSDKPSSEKSGMCQRNKSQKDRKELELTPAFLPNTSPNEVVSDWLRSLPTNGNLLALDELNKEEQEVKEKEEVEEKPGEEVVKEEDSPDAEKVDEEEEADADEKEEKEEEVECDAAEGEKSADPAPGVAVGTSVRTTNLLLSGDSQPKNLYSSVAVMKVLLGPSLSRSRSLPEVSPVYGRRLSTSAKGLLDCLAQLQLIEPAVNPGCDPQKDRKQQYDDIMAILQSLWLTDPKDIEVKKSNSDQVTPPRSSSGVGMSSGSGGSGKENVNQGGDEIPPKETESLHEDEGAEKVEEEKEEEENEEAGDQEIEAEEEPESEETKPDTAEEQVQIDEQSTTPPSLDSPKATDNPSSSDKSSVNDSSKSPTDNEREQEDSSSGTPPTVVRAPLSKRLSQDPDPVWVLQLLKKLEKQFMNHYINAMAEFKVRWDLDDSLILDTMISELREEVSRRIQTSIEREMRKIQSRAGKVGRSPRPPQLGNLSRESTVTDRRRQMLKVMKNQSVNPADTFSDNDITGEFSDQRSEDEYCPCDACVRKKMAERPFKSNPLASDAPLMMEFDLLKILQLKKSPSPAPVSSLLVEGESESMVDEEGRNLEVVQEEEEEDETKEDIKAEVVLEETIPEEDEEEMGDEQEENDGGDEEQEEGETGGEEAAEEGGSENGEEEEEEEECPCCCARNEEESDKAEEGEEGEGETAEGEEGEETTGNTEDEGETGEDEEAKEATADEGETTENGEGEEEEGETDLANEESTPVEELVEGNISSSAEDESKGDDGTGEDKSNEDEEGGESEETSQQGETPTVTEGEEADAEDSNTGECVITGDEEEKEGGGNGDEEEVVEDAVEEFKPKEEEGEEIKGNWEDGALHHQVTRTSMESQPGSMEDIGRDSPQNPVIATEVPKKATDGSTGGVCQRTSRSPARVKRRKPKESDVA